MVRAALDVRSALVLGLGLLRATNALLVGVRGVPPYTAAISLALGGLHSAGPLGLLAGAANGLGRASIGRVGACPRSCSALATAATLGDSFFTPLCLQQYCIACFISFAQISRSPCVRSGAWSLLALARRSAGTRGVTRARATKKALCVRTVSSTSLCAW